MPPTRTEKQKMKKRICYIIGAGEPSLPLCLPKREETLVIAADGGYPLAVRLFGNPDLAVGDFDSLGYLPEGVKTVTHPREKDDTDMALAAELAIADGVGELVILGALGGRLDHTVANLQLLVSLAARGVRTTLVGADGVAVTALVGGECALFPATAHGTLSVFAFGGEAVGVTLSGLAYPLADATLTPSRPLGISNELMGTEAVVGLRAGTLLLFYPYTEEATPTVKKANV